MPESNGSNEEKKKYTVVDKRRVSEDAAEGEQAPKPEPPKPAEAPKPAEPRARQEPDEEPGESGGQQGGRRRAPGIEDAFMLIVSLLRENALASLGMLEPAAPGKFKPDLKKAEEAAAFFNDLASKFPDIIKMYQPELPPEEQQLKSDLQSLIAMSFNIMQSHILIHLGLIADPVTGLITKDLAQARKGVDIFAALVEIGARYLPPQFKSQLDAALADLRLNFVEQSKLI